MSFNPSWADLLARASTTPAKICLELSVLHLQNDPYRAFVGLVARGLDFSIQCMARDKNVLQGLSEDQLTVVLLGPLKGMTFDASHDTNTGGHCDVVIDGPDEMLWLGEAKKYTSYTKLLGGFRQLMDRYATGTPQQSDGGMIIYSFEASTNEIMAQWRSYLEEAETIQITDVPTRPLEFISTRAHVGTGQPITVRHTPVVLFHRPTDTEKPPKRTRRAKESS